MKNKKLQKQYQNQDILNIFVDKNQLTKTDFNKPKLNALYDPIIFNYSFTIGIKNSRKQQQKMNQYQWGHHDIVIPSSTNLQSSFLLYFFHIAPIYNWLRSVQCYERQLLNNYIINKLQNNTINNRAILIEQLIEKIISYAEKWQIVKLCLKNKIYIQNQLSSVCEHVEHYLKRQIYSYQYTYNPKQQIFQHQIITCSKCMFKSKVKAEIKQLAFAPILSRYFGMKINIKYKGSQRYLYYLRVVFTNDDKYVKCSNGVWYKLSKNYSQIIGSQQIQIKKGKLFVYQRQIQSQNKLKMALPIQVQLKNSQNSIVVPRIAVLNKKMLKKKSKKKPKNLKQTNKDKNKFKKDKFQQKYDSNEQLQDLKPKDHNMIVINKNNKSLIKNYVKSVEDMMYKPKIKDQYELNYDKGKTKKIKKKKNYLKPNFNQLYQQIRDRKKDQQKQYL